jgi:hypothetical protein
MSRLETDKLTHRYTISIPSRLHTGLQRMNAVDRKKMNDRLMVLMAECVHRAMFDPLFYLKTPDNLKQGLHGLLDAQLEEGEET